MDARAQYRWRARRRQDAHAHGRVEQERGVRQRVVHERECQRLRLRIHLEDELDVGESATECAQRWEVRMHLTVEVHRIGLRGIELEPAEAVAS